MHVLMALAAQKVKQQTSKREQRVSAFWTLAGTVLLLAVYSVINNGYGDLFSVLSRFLQADLQGAQSHAMSLMRLAPVVAAATVIMVVLGVSMIPLLAVRIKRIDPEHNKQQKKNMFEVATPRRQFLMIMALLVTEELYARWLFLGVLHPHISFLSGVAGFYLLFFIGNGSWALVHLFNYKNKKLRNPVMVLPQFVGGIVLTGVYISFGLVGAILVHVAYDMILFALDRRDRFNGGEIALVIYHTIIGAIALAMFTRSGHDLRDMKVWLNADLKTMALPGWSFADYVWAVLFITSVITVVLELLLFDREGGETRYEAFRHFVLFVLSLMAAFTVMAMLNEVWHEAVAIKILLLSVVLTFLVKSASGSGVARAWWEALTIMSVTLAAIVAVGPLMAGWLVLILAVVHGPDRLIRYLDKDAVTGVAEAIKQQVVASSRA